MSTGEFGWFKQYMWRHSLSRKKPDWKHCVNFPLECGTERIGFVEELLAQWFYAGNRGRKNKLWNATFHLNMMAKNGCKKSKSGVE